ncbi:MAG: HEAT repeat domain-containing protein, partial [Vicinamibacteria bacterium]
MLRALSLTLVLTALSLTAAAQAPLRERLLAVEDARDAGPAGVAVIKEALASRDAGVRRVAVRAAGRFEQPQLLDLIVPALTDADAGVRQEAANAAGQAAVGSDVVIAVHGRLLRRLQAEQDPATWGVVAATLGRLRYERSEHVSATESAMRRVLPPPASGAALRAGADAPVVNLQREAVLGAVKGFEALFRQSRKLLPPSSETIGQLRASAILRVAGDDDVIVRVRRLAWAALTSAEAVDASLVAAGLDDPDGEVRRLALVAAGNAAALSGRDALLRRGLADAHAPARYEALRAWGRHLQSEDCAPVTAAVNDADAHVALLAIDLLGEGCPGGVAPVSMLRALAEPMPTAPGAWHRAAHAAVALATASPDDGRDLLPRMLAHATWQVRMYAARVAAAA